MTPGDGTAGPVYQAIRRRRVTRSMTTEPVDPAQVEAVVRAARYAPNAGNRRLQPIVTVVDPALLRRLRMVSPGMIMRPQAIAVICIDLARAEAFGFRRDTPGLYVDVGTAAATMLLAADAVGLGACPVSSFSRAAANRLLGLDAGVTAQLFICLGHPSGSQPQTMTRLRP